MVLRRDLGVVWSWVEPCEPGTGVYAEVAYGPLDSPDWLLGAAGMGIELDTEVTLFKFEVLGTESLAGEACVKQRTVVEMKDQAPESDTPGVGVRLTATTWVSQTLNLPLQGIVSVEVYGPAEPMEFGSAEEGAPWLKVSEGGETVSFTVMTVVMRFHDFDLDPIPEAVFEPPPGYVKETEPPLTEDPEVPLPLDELETPLLFDELEAPLDTASPP